jgi:poly(beta-D-mannuronate) lyase
MNKLATYLFISCFICIVNGRGYAAVYFVNNKADLQTRMTAALPGDTVVVTNNTYNWGTINFTNVAANAAAARIVLKAQTNGGVVFTGSTRIEFKGNNIQIEGFTFNNGNAGSSAVIRLGTSSTNVSNDCRITNITIDNYNSAVDVENEWIGIFGVRNRIDHCTFINKSNPRATVVVWYSPVTYPAEAVSTYHRIDSNYFKGRSYMGANGGETIRVGDSNTSRTNGFNIIESNLFEDCSQAEPEIISNKSDFNVYRYNTFRNCDGGITLRHGRYCQVYGNYFIRDNATTTAAYGIRIIDKGHKVFNNYFEGLNGNSGGTSQNRAVISLMNGLSVDTTDAAAASGYFPADSALVAYNTIVDCKGGGGIVVGNTSGGTYEPKGIVLANNLVKMNSGTALYSNPVNTATTFYSEGNIYQAPGGLGMTAPGWQAQTLTFSSRSDGILHPPSLVMDASMNTAAYAQVLNNKDVTNRTRSAVFDVGCEELNATGTITNTPLNAWEVGANASANSLPVRLISFAAVVKGKQVDINWSSANEINLYEYQLEYSLDGIHFKTLAQIAARNTTSATYSYLHNRNEVRTMFYRLKQVDNDGSFVYSAIVKVKNTEHAISITPNPATSFITINLADANKSVTVKIIDIQGKGVVEFTRVSNVSSMQVPIQTLPAGLYYVKLYAGDQLISSSSFIKQ